MSFFSLGDILWEAAFLGSTSHCAIDLMIRKVIDPDDASFSQKYTLYKMKIPKILWGLQIKWKYFKLLRDVENKLEGWVIWIGDD